MFNDKYNKWFNPKPEVKLSDDYWIPLRDYWIPLREETIDEQLDKFDIKDIEQYLRRKKMKNINNGK